MSPSSPLSLSLFLPALQSESLVQDVSGPPFGRLSGLMNVLSLHWARWGGRYLENLAGGRGRLTRACSLWTVMRLPGMAGLGLCRNWAKTK